MKELSIQELSLNPMTMFGKEWCVVAAGNEANGYNAMTIAWGHLGAIWDRNTPKGKTIIPTAVVYLRPSVIPKNFSTGKNCSPSAPLTVLTKRRWAIWVLTPGEARTKRKMQD